MVIASLPADSFYIILLNSAFNSPCISYQLKIRALGITGTGVPVVTSTRFDV